MSSVKKRFAWKLCILILVVISGMIWLDRGSLFQEGNPLIIIPSLIRLEYSKTELSPVRNNPKLFIAKISYKHDVIDKYLAHYGWKRNDQEGSLLPYHRGKESLDVYARIYMHGRYWAYELSRTPK